MVTKIPLSGTTNYFAVVPDELLLNIFQLLDLAGCLSAKKVCKKWLEMIAHPSTIYSQYVQEKNQIEELSRLSPRVSAWSAIPRHWGIVYSKKLLKFSYVFQDIIAFSPSFYAQSSKFFSFSLPLPFSDKNILLAQCSNTYFLTPQGEPKLQLHSHKDLKPLASHKLIVINTTDATKNREFSLLPANETNLADYQIEHCFPISESKIAIFTSRQITFWDLLPEKPTCYETLQLKDQSNFHKVGNHLISDTEIIDLSKPSIVGHKFNFKDELITTWGSSFCALSREKIRFFSINSKGFPKKKPNLMASDFTKFTNTQNGTALSYAVTDMSEKFIVVSYWQQYAINLFILNNKRKLVHSITKNISGQPMDLSKTRAYPIFAQLSGNILVYKDPLKHTLFFWHIPTKKCILEFEWTKAIDDLSLSSGKAYIQDVRLSNNKLTILLSSGHTLIDIAPPQFRIIQFDPQYNPSSESGLWGMVSSVCSFVKQAYYAFPSRNPS